MVLDIIKKFYKIIKWVVWVLCDIICIWFFVISVKTGQADVWDYAFATVYLGISIIELIFNPFTKKLRQKRKSKPRLSVKSPSHSLPMCLSRLISLLQSP